jgi:NAD-dependent deacetylase
MWDRNPHIATFTTASRWHGKAQQAWDHWTELRRGASIAQPNAAHKALVDVEARFDVHVATQNIDGLHIRAGSTNVTELHGNVFQTRCSGKACHTRHGAWFDDNLHETVPTCPHCGRIARPDVVLFGERLLAGKMRAAIHAARHADVWIAIGTSGTVFPAAGLIDFCRPGTVRILVNAQPWIDNAAKFDQQMLCDAAAVIGDVLRDVRPAALQ